MPTPTFDLSELLSNELIEAHFQPIISIRKKTVIGYEGLSRGIPNGFNDRTPPQELFYQAAQTGRTLELDRLCRKKVLEGFKPIAAQHPDRFLSLNFEASVIDQGVVGSGELMRQVKASGLDPSTISLEIIESNVKDVGDLQKFIQTHRDHGFLIALDDVGAGHSNLNRIPLLKPDILKIDRYLIQNIHTEFYKQEVFKSLANLSRKIGALTLAEGVETEEEALAVMDLGADMIQGFYFSKPHPASMNDGKGLNEKIGSMTGKYKEAVLRKMNIKQFNLKKYDVMTREVQIELSKVKAGGFDQKLREMARFFPLVECLYVLNDKGAQVTETIFGNQDEKRRNPLMFKPATKGEDHTMKDYFYMMLDGGLRKTTFITEPYLSLATGNICITFARLFRNVDRDAIFILCADINTEFLQKISLGLFE